MTEATLATVTVFFLLSPLWMPVAFVFYAIWRERFSRTMVAALAIAECFSLGLAYFALQMIAYGA